MSAALIQQLAPEHATLVSDIAQLDWAHAALAQQQSYIHSLEESLKKVNAELKKLDSQTKKEGAEAKDLEDSVTRRFLYKATGQKKKFEDKLEKESKEYLEALETQQNAKNRKESVNGELSAAKHQEAEYQNAVTHHRDLVEKLQALYRSAFDGPTPSFPEEDHLEWAFKEASLKNENAQRALTTENQVVTCINGAANGMNKCLKALAEALDASSMDMWGVGGRAADMVERSSLSAAQAAAAQVQMYVSHAQSLQPAIPPLPPFNIAQGHTLSDIYFDNIFSDMAFHDKIEASNREANAAAKWVQTEVHRANQRQQQVTLVASQAAEEFRIVREKLEAKRREIFEGAGAPPSYT